MKLRFYVLSAIILLSLAFCAYADLDVKAEIVEDSIYLDEHAIFKITIENTDSVQKVVQIYTPDVQWYTELEPSLTVINAKSSVEVLLKLIPSVWAEPGAQNVNVVVESPNYNDKIALTLPVYVKSFDSGNKEYVPSVEMKVTFPDKIDPRKPLELDVYMRNRNRLDITALEISVETELFKDYKTVPMPPLSERREKFSFDIDDLTMPQQGMVEVRLTIGNRTINRERSVFSIIGFSGFVIKQDSIQELFKTTVNYIILNEGNVEKSDAFSVPTSFLKKVFTSTDPGYERVSFKEGHLEWDLKLMPMEEVTITVKENYRPLLYSLVLFVFVVMIYFIYRSPVTVRKESIVTGSSDEGISEMKVLLHVRNRSQDIIERLSVTDLIPSIAVLLKDSHIGTVAPSKIIRHDRKGTLIKWELEALEPFEERIITYRLKSKVTIVGGFVLPPAKLKFDTKSGKERTIRSNSSRVSLGI